MDVKEAVSTAKAYVSDLFSEDRITNIGLEEVEKEGQLWSVTIGFSRPWDTENTLSAMLAGQAAPKKRVFKVVTVDDESGTCVSVRNRSEVP